MNMTISTGVNGAVVGGVGVRVVTSVFLNASSIPFF